MKSVYLVGCVKRDISRWINRHSLEKPVDLSAWYCGISHHNDISKLEEYLKKKGVTELYFKCWLANDLMVCQEILTFFIKNGMKNKTVKGKVNNRAKFVYVFKVHPQILDEVIDLVS